MQFDPFWMFRSPLSGNVAEKISAPWFSPALTVNYAGDPAVEEKVATEVASYGRQVGWLNEVVLALAQKADLPQSVAETVQRMAEASKKIEEIKAAHKQDTLAAAVASLNRLQHEQPAAYDELLRSRSLESNGR